MKAALAVVALAFVAWAKKKHGGGREAYQRGVEAGYLLGRSQGSPRLPRRP